MFRQEINEKIEDEIFNENSSEYDFDLPTVEDRLSPDCCVTFQINPFDERSFNFDMIGATPRI